MTDTVEQNIQLVEYSGPKYDYSVTLPPALDRSGPKPPAFGRRARQLSGVMPIVRNDPVADV